MYIFTRRNPVCHQSDPPINGNQPFWKKPTDKNEQRKQCQWTSIPTLYNFSWRHVYLYRIPDIWGAQLQLASISVGGKKTRELGKSWTGVFNLLLSPLHPESGKKYASSSIPGYLCCEELALVRASTAAAAAWLDSKLAWGSLPPNCHIVVKRQASKQKSNQSAIALWPAHSLARSLAKM